MYIIIYYISSLIVYSILLYYITIYIYIGSNNICLYYIRLLNNVYDLNLSPIPFCCVLEPFFVPNPYRHNEEHAVNTIPIVAKTNFISCTNSKCKAYLNPYCKLDPKLSQWSCVFCNQWSATNELNNYHASAKCDTFQSPVKSDNEQKRPYELTNNIVDVIIPYQHIVKSSHNLAT